MPYKVERRSGKHCVVNKTSGDTVACHSTRRKADNQLKALYISEQKKAKAARRRSPLGGFSRVRLARLRLEPDLAPSTVPALAGEPLGTVEGVLTTEGQWTGDDRMFEPGSTTWNVDDPAGMPIRWVEFDKGAHDDAKHVGWIRSVERVDDSINFQGDYFDPAYGEYLKAAGKAGLSVDCDDETYKLVKGEVVDTPEGPQQGLRQSFTAARIRAVTTVSIPAFVTGYVTLSADVPPESATEFAVGDPVPPATPAAEPSTAPTHSGVLLVANDTGRWLMLQREYGGDDPNAGLWEFPGGRIDEGETPEIGAAREFAEEIGVPLPTSVQALGEVDSTDGVYRLFVMSVESESDIDIDAREVSNPDDPDGDASEAVAWWEPGHVTVGGYHIRPEVQNTDWDAVSSILSDDPVEEPEMTTLSVELHRGPSEGIPSKAGPANKRASYKEASGRAEKYDHQVESSMKQAKSASNAGTAASHYRDAAQAAVGSQKAHEAARAEAGKAKDFKAQSFHEKQKKEAVAAESKAKKAAARAEAGKFGLEELDMTTLAEAPPTEAGPMELTEAERSFIQKMLDDEQAEVDELNAWIDANPESPLVPGLKERAVNLTEDIDELTAILSTTPEAEAEPPSEEDAMVAAAAPVAPPDEWFEPMSLKGPTPLTITADGRVFGHLATWDSCHRSEKFAKAGKCVQPPSDPNPGMFHLGQVLTASGKTIDAGRLTVGGGHADINGNLYAALEHYDDVSATVAAVRAHEDEYGIGLFGAVVAGATPEQIAALRLSPLSGDWRKERGRYRLVAAHAVNVPGYPVERTADDYTLVASVSPTAFITAGRVCETCGSVEEGSHMGLVAATALRASIRETFSDDLKARRAALRSEFASTLNDRRAGLRALVAAI